MALVNIKKVLLYVCKHGYKDLIRVIDTKYVEENLQSLLWISIVNNQLQIAKWLYDINPIQMNQFKDNAFTYERDECKDVEMYKWLIEIWPHFDNSHHFSRVFYNACVNNRLPLIKWLCEYKEEYELFLHEKLKNSIKLIDTISTIESFDTLKYLWKVFPRLSHNWLNLLKHAYKNNNLVTIKWILNIRGCLDDIKLIEIINAHYCANECAVYIIDLMIDKSNINYDASFRFAIINNKYELCKKLCSNGHIKNNLIKQWCGATTIECRQLLKSLSNNCYDGMTQRALNEYVLDNKLSLQWLLENTNNKYNILEHVTTLITICKKGYVDMCKYVCKDIKLSKRLIRKCLKQACIYIQYDVIVWLQGLGGKLTDVMCQHIYLNACIKGNLLSLPELPHIIRIANQQTCFQNAVLNNHIDIAKYLFNDHSLKEYVIKKCCEKGYVDMYIYLKSKFVIDSHICFIEACKHDQLNLCKCIYILDPKVIHVRQTSYMFKMALTSKKYDLANWLYSQNNKYDMDYQIAFHFACMYEEIDLCGKMFKDHSDKINVCEGDHYLFKYG